MGFVCLRTSDAQESFLPGETIVIVDEMGQLPLYYALATIAFIGKSLSAHGGQNILEPAALGKVILFGPHMENFRYLAELFLNNEAAVQIRGPADLEASVRRFLKSDEMRERFSANARQLVEKYKGAVVRNLQLMDRYLWR